MSDLPPLLPNDGSAAVSARFAPLVKAEEALAGEVPVPTPTLPPTLHVLEAKEGMDGRMLSPPPQRWKSEKQAALLPALAPSHAPPHKTKPRRRWRGLTITLLLFRLARGGVAVQALWQAVGSLAVFIAPLALRRIVDFISHYAGEGREGGEGGEGEEEVERGERGMEISDGGSLSSHALPCPGLPSLPPSLQARRSSPSPYWWRRPSSSSAPPSKASRTDRISSW